MDNTTTTPEYLFESSWEVCNKVGGIYTVLSTKAHTLQRSFKDKLIFIGPDVWTDTNAPDFIEDDVLFADWKTYTKTTENLKVKVGRWNVPGTPPVILVDFKPFFKEKDSFFFSMWESFRVDSIHAYGDYDESCIFAYAVGKVIESFYHFYKLENKKVAALFNEWMLGMGALYIKKQLPAVATLFTTHATSIGRSIAGNNKALYAYMDGYNGDQMAGELNMEAKHSLEKQTALHVDCFTTVSDITARECKQLLDKAPDIVTPNGFEPNFVPSDKEYDKKRMAARRDLLNVAEKLLGCPISPDAFLVSTSGRYEYRNKGIDVFIEAMNRVRTSGRLQREVVAFIMVPAWVRDARADLKEVIDKNIRTTSPMQMPFVTHWLNQMEQDKVLNYISHAGFTNSATDKLKIIFVPCYLDGRDGILNKPYYDLLIGTVGSGSSARDLIEYAFRDKRVIIVSPTSFLAYLQTVLQGLRSLQIEEQARDIQVRVGQLGTHIRKFDELLGKMGRSLSTTVNHYNNSYKELAKIDKDVVKIAGGDKHADPNLVDRPQTEE